MARPPEARRSLARAGLAVLLIGAGACASPGPMRLAVQAEQRSDYDRAVVEYTNALRDDPDNRTARMSLDRVRMRASEDHFFRGRRLAAAGRDEEAAVELQLATELNPTNAAAEAELRVVRQRLRAKIAVARGGKTDLQTLVERARTMPPPGLDLPEGAKLPDSMTFSTGSRMIFTAIAKFADLNVVFDPAFRDERISADLRNTTLSGALASLTGVYSHVLPRHRPAHDHDRSRHARQAPRVRRADRPDVLSEQRRDQGSHRPPAHRRRRPADLADHGGQRDLAEGHAGAHRRRGPSDYGYRQGAPGGRHRRRTAGNRQDPAARVWSAVRHPWR